MIFNVIKVARFLLFSRSIFCLSTDINFTSLAFSSVKRHSNGWWPVMIYENGAFYLSGEGFTSAVNVGFRFTGD